MERQFKNKLDFIVHFVFLFVGAIIEMVRFLKVNKYPVKAKLIVQVIATVDMVSKLLADLYRFLYYIGEYTESI